MDGLSIAAASGMRARMESLEMLANNLANAATDGYKSDQEFYSLYVSPEAEGKGDFEPSTVPVVERPWTDFSQGLLRVTGSPLDLALSGKGFFAVDGKSGTLYTRNGHLRMSASGQVQTTEGYAVRTEDGSVLQGQFGKPIEVGLDGTVRQEGQVLGKLAVVDFADTAGLSKVGNNYLQQSDPNVKPAPASGVEVQQGKLEGSNVSTAQAAVRLIGVMRQFEMLQKAISLGADMNRKAVEEVARVSQ
jgi:flagellar basal body rod protein FlgG